MPNLWKPARIGRFEGISKAVSMFKSLNLTKDVAIRQIGESYAMTNEEAAAPVNSRR